MTKRQQLEQALRAVNPEVMYLFDTKVWNIKECFTDTVQFCWVNKILESEHTETIREAWKIWHSTGELPK